MARRPHRSIPDPLNAARVLVYNSLCLFHGDPKGFHFYRKCRFNEILLQRMTQVCGKSLWGLP
jgi:hypothetical protein